MSLPTDPDTLRVPAFMRKRNIRSRNKKRLILTALDRKNAGLPPEGLNKNETVTLPGLVAQNFDSRSLAGATNTRIDDAPGVAKTTRRKPRPKYARAIRKTTKLTRPSLGPRPSFSLSLRPKKVELVSIVRPVFRVKSKVAPKPKMAPRAKTRTKSATKSVTKSKITPFETFSAPLLDSYDFDSPQKSSGQKKIGTMTHYYDKIKVGVIKLSGTLEVGDCITYDTADGPYEEIVESMEIDREPVFKAGRNKEVGLKLRRKPRDNCTVYIG